MRWLIFSIYMNPSLCSVSYTHLDVYKRQGLDSQSAWSIVQFMRALADSGQSILCTIHQPSATLFEQFDRLLLLKKGGKMVYFGDIGPNSETLLKYFERQSGMKCGVSENPAEYILNCIGAGATASVNSDWHDLWLASPECAAARAEVEELHRTLPGRAVNDDPELATRSVSYTHLDVYKRQVQTSTSLTN